MCKVPLHLYNYCEYICNGGAHFSDFDTMWLNMDEFDENSFSVIDITVLEHMIWYSNVRRNIIDSLCDLLIVYIEKCERYQHPFERMVKTLTYLSNRLKYLSPNKQNNELVMSHVLKCYPNERLRKCLFDLGAKLETIYGDDERNAMYIAADMYCCYVYMCNI
jgi:hypothetical protein